jgi:copper chaperone CopZ
MSTHPAATLTRGREHLPSDDSCVLDIGGMTCVACVNRIERTLSRLDGVSVATVNLAAETATVDYDPEQVSIEALCEAVVSAGCTASVRVQPENGRTLEDPTDARLEGPGHHRTVRRHGSLQVTPTVECRCDSKSAHHASLLPDDFLRVPSGLHVPRTPSRLGNQLLVQSHPLGGSR